MTESPNDNCTSGFNRFFNGDVGAAYANMVEVITVMENQLGGQQPQLSIGPELISVRDQSVFEAAIQVSSSSSEELQTIDAIKETLDRRAMPPPKSKPSCGEPSVSSSTNNKVSNVEANKDVEVEKKKLAKPLDITAYFHDISVHLVKSSIDEAAFNILKSDINCWLESQSTTNAMGKLRFST